MSNPCPWPRHRYKNRVRRSVQTAEARKRRQLLRRGKRKEQPDDRQPAR